MRKKNLSLSRWILFCLCFTFIPIALRSQTPPPQSRIVERVNESALVTLRGNTHPLAQAQFDQGAAPPDLPMSRMLLVLKRSDAQEAVLQALLDAQQDPGSPSYHQWLTPDVFGQQFGPSDLDIQAVATWLQSHGFQVTRIAKGRTVIEFSGTAAQVQQAFHTEIRKYSVNGLVHWANASDPQIPQALSPVITGVNSLHNFQKTPAHHVTGVFSKSRTTGKVEAVRPGFTISNSNFCPGAGDCYFLGPYDFATIYNVLPLWNASPATDGTGQNIAIIGRSDINIQDVRDFRNLFGLPPNDPQFIIDGPDPGVIPGDETEADLDVEWSGAVAKGATIHLVISESTETTDGVDLSAVYAVDNNVAPVISESFGQCELFLGTAGNTFENSIRQQAAAQGITFLTSAGDVGSAGCDSDSATPPAPATYGLMVSGLASSPYGVAVGGTDFLNFGPNYTYNSLFLPSPYWSQTNNANQASALGYVPESTWNDSCTNNIYVVLGAGISPYASCNNSELVDGVLTVGGSGGKSNCTTSSGSTPADCTGGYAKPSWQSAPGVPADGARDIPDVSLFASNGFVGSAYILCEADQVQSGGTCGLTGIDYDFLGIGGTSASSPAMAGIMALVNQYTQSSGQGNANYVLYKLASSATQTSAKCNSSVLPASACIFNDVTSGTIAMPCVAASPNCTVNAGEVYGVLSGYAAATGFDLATGLGSVNAYNLVHNWSSPGISTTTTLSLNSNNPVSITHGTSVPFTITVAPGAATGDVSLIGSPTTGSSIAMGQFTLANGAISDTTASLAGGASYQVRAHYAGDSTYAPSDSAAVAVTVAPEASNTLISIPVFNPNTGQEMSNNPTSLVYGSVAFARVDVGNAKAALSFPAAPVCAQFTCPTGSITLTDSVSGGPAGTFPLNSEGYAEAKSVQLLGGVHQLTASYPGDNSYQSSTGNYALTVEPAPTFMAPPTVSCSPCTVGAPISMSVEMEATSIFSGAVPAGTITFYDGTTPLAGTVTYFGIGGVSFSSTAAFLLGSSSATLLTNGMHQISASYSGDANYAAAASPATSVAIYYPTTMMVTSSASNINLGQTVNITATVTGGSKTPPMTGTLQFSTNPNPVTPTQGTDSNGNQTLTAMVTVTPQTSNAIYVYYPGDANYASNQNSAFVTVNIPDFSLIVPSSPLILTGGQPASMVVTVMPASTMASTVALSCGGNISGENPGGYTCSVSPASVNLSNGASVNVTVTLSQASQTPAALVKRAAFPVHAGPSGNFPSALNGTLFFSGILALSVLVWPIAWPTRRARTAMFMFGVICLAVGCGSTPAGSGGGGGGGGGSTPVPEPTTTMVSESAAKVAEGGPLSFSATVNGSNNPTGSVLFNLNGNFSGSANLVNKTATISGEIPWLGYYALDAQYTGDPLNSPSTSSGINLTVTGTSYIGLQGETGTDNHFYLVNYTVQ